MYPALAPWAVGVTLPLAETAPPAAAADFGGITVDLSADPEAVRGILEANHLKPAAWGLPVQFRTDEETFRTGFVDLPAVAKNAQLMGADRCSTYIMPFSDEYTFEENYELHLTRLRACAKVLAEHGCRLGLEFVGPKTLRAGHPYEFIFDMQGMLSLVEDIDVGNVGLLLDSFHWHTSHGTAEDLATLTDDLVVDVHINDGAPGRTPDEQIDNDRRLPGATGVIDLVTFLKGLKGIGYTGPVTPEPFDATLKRMSPEDAIRATAEALLGVWKKAGV